MGGRYNLFLFTSINPSTFQYDTQQTQKLEIVNADKDIAVIANNNTNTPSHKRALTPHI